VRDSRPPEYLFRRVERGEHCPLGGIDTECGERGVTVGLCVAVRVDARDAVRDGEDLQHASVVGGDPCTLRTIVVTDRDDRAYRERKEVLDVER
jgi:hypothetical protein